MRLGRVITGALVGTALVMGSIAPAAARDRHWDDRGWGGGRDRHWHHHDDFDFGDAVGIAALIGAIAVVASSMSKDRQARAQGDNGSDAPPPPPSSGADGRYDDGRYGDDSRSNRDDSGAIASEDAAVNACAVAARDEASGPDGYAEIRDIGQPEPIDRGWNIDGRVEQRASYRDDKGTLRRFTCTVRDGRVAEVYLSRDPATT